MALEFVRNPPASVGGNKRFGFHPWVGMIPWSRVWQPTPVFLPGESYGQRSLEGYSPRGHKESDMTEVTEHKHKVLRVVKIKNLKVEWLLPESRGKG